MAGGDGGGCGGYGAGDSGCGGGVVMGIVDEIDEFCGGMMTIQEGMSLKE